MLGPIWTAVLTLVLQAHGRSYDLGAAYIPPMHPLHLGRGRHILLYVMPGSQITHLGTDG